MIPLGPSDHQYKYLPGLRYALAPFGPESYLENFLIVPEKRPLYAYVRWGEHASNKYYGAGFEMREIFKCHNFNFGLIFDLFKQPKILSFDDCQQTTISTEGSDDNSGYELGFDYPENELKKSTWGARASLVIAYQFTPRTPLFLELEVGYKTKGFVEGETIKEKVLIKGGFSAQF